MKQSNRYGASVWRLMAAFVVMAAFLAGCGDMTTTGYSGGGQIVAGVGTGGTGVVKASARVVAAESGLVGAVVFRDLNGNRQPDSDEPTAVTDQNGRYMVPNPVEGATAPLLMMAIEGLTVVKATGEVVASGFVTELP